MGLRISVTALILSISVWAYSQSAECTLKKEKDGIRVYSCKSDTSKYHSLQADFSVHNTTIDQLEKFLLDIPNYVNWQYNTLEAEVLKQAGTHDFTYRALLDAPWPVENRELIVQFKAMKTAAGELHLILNSTMEESSPPKGVVRVPFSQSRWYLKTAGTSVDVKFELNLHPGGQIPAWLVNMMLADGPYQSFRNIKKLME